MRRFAGLPQRNTTPSPGARFTNLPEELAAMSRPGNVDRIRAAAKGEAFTGRLATTKRTAAEPAKPAAKAESKPVAKSATPPTAKPAAAAPPPRKLGRAETVANAVRTDPKLKGMDDIGLHMLDDTDLKGLSGDGIVRCMQGIDAAKYRAGMAEEKRKATVAHADGVWSRARASIDGRGVASTAPATTTNPPAHGRKLTAAEARADAVWEKARASIDRNRPAALADQKPAAKAKSSSADDIWTRAYAAIAR